MARRRMIDPHVWDNEQFCGLSHFAKIVFIGLISLADDEGRGLAKPVYLKSKLFPYDENLRSSDLSRALEEIRSGLSVELYAVDGKEYYALSNWAKWQSIDKPKPSVIPGPEEADAPKMSEAPSEKPAENKSTESLSEGAFQDSGNNTGTFADSSANNPGSVKDESGLKEKEKKEKLNGKGKEGEGGYGGKPPTGRFVPPTPQEVDSYAQEKGLSLLVDGESFCDFYRSKNWMVGMVKMTDWKASVRNWARRSQNDRRGKPAAAPPDNPFLSPELMSFCEGRGQGD